MKLVAGTYLFVLAVMLVLAFVFVVPSFKAQQIASCEMIESGLSQFNPQQNQYYPPMTAEQCIVAVENAWFNRAFIGTVGSMVIAGFATPVALFALYVLATIITKDSGKK